MSHLILLLFVLVVHTASATTVQLSPFEHINGELLELDTGVKEYQLLGLEANTGYEVRLSWPASIPATIKFQLVDGAAPQQGERALRRHSRRLLDCEQLKFYTDSKGSVQGFEQPVVLITAFRRSVHKDGPKAGAPKLVYNIVLAELAFGLPLDTFPTIALVVLLVLAAFVWSLYWTHRLFPRLLVWVTSAPEPYQSSAASITVAHKRRT